MNLSRSGARTADVVETQVPRVAGLGLAPDLLTAVVGANDALHTPALRWYADAERLAALASVPAGRAVVSTASPGVREGKAWRVNAHLRWLAAEQGLLVADLWATTGRPHRGKYADGYHPNDRGYGRWAEAVTRALDLPPPAEEPLS